MTRLPLAALALATGCATAPTMKTVDRVDLPRFMGDWYVLAHIPASVEKNAWAGVESYRLDPDGSIATTYTFREGGFDGKEKSYHPRGFVRNRETNAEWGMRFIWPFRSEYLIVHLDEGYTETIIGRSDRDLVWIMARAPSLPQADYDRLVAKVKELGYDVAKLRKVPQLRERAEP
jgi:apolipoprotein D and lipocalin family protein